MQRQNSVLRGLGFACLFGLIGTGVFAQALTDTLVAELRAQGFTKITLTRTWLGRILIIGMDEAGQREIVVNPNTGEILRDYFRPTADFADRNGDGSNSSPAVQSTPVVGDDPPDRRPSRPNRTPPKDDDAIDPDTDVGTADDGNGSGVIGIDGGGEITPPDGPPPNGAGG